jgi:pimeloyl-ACP methyl ester carboxylesterase
MTTHLSRKQFLRAGALALAAGIAGCNAPATDSTTTTAADTDTVQSTDTTTPADADGPPAPASASQFYVGSDGAEDAAIDGRAAVTAVRPDTADRTPIVMVPGLGLSPYIYLGTPDGRPGWAALFADAGHPVYLFDPPRNVTSGGLDPAALAGDDTATLSRWSLDRAWPTWGFGPAVGEPYDDVRYPADHVDQLVASFPAYVSTGGGAGGGGGGGGQRGGQQSGGDGSGRGGGGGAGDGGGQQGGGGRFASTREIAALEALLERVGPATLLVHSAGGPAGFQVVGRRPDLVSAVVAVEPVGCPTDPAAVDVMEAAPFMAVYGDYVAERGQTGRKDACETTADLASEDAPDSTLLDLPAEGVTGNTHLLMQDDNNDAIAGRIQSWLDG